MSFPRFPKMPRFGQALRSFTDLVARAPVVPREQAIRRGTFQRRGVVQRRGVRGTTYAIGVTPLEARAYQGIEGSLGERIVYNALIQRREMFQYQSNVNGQGIEAVPGQSFAFLIETHLPGIALDVIPGQEDSLRYRFKQLFVEAFGLRYVILSEVDDIFPSAARLDDALNLALGYGPASTDLQASLMAWAPELVSAGYSPAQVAASLGLRAVGGGRFEGTSVGNRIRRSLAGIPVIGWQR